MEKEKNIKEIHSLSIPITLLQKPKADDPIALHCQLMTSDSHKIETEQN